MAAGTNPLVRPAHIQDDISELNAALEGVTDDSFAVSYVLRRTAEPPILIISEAVKASLAIAQSAIAEACTL